MQWSNSISNGETFKMINQNEINIDTIIKLLKTSLSESNYLFEFANSIKQKAIGNKVHIRGIIELSNICSKDCYYCGIRKSNKKLERYNITDEEVLQTVAEAQKVGYTSIVIQSGEIIDEHFTERIENLLKAIKQMSDGKLGITLSLGEQTTETYQRWFQAGAHRYLLRIESSNPDLYYKIHPKDEKHNFENRLKCLISLKQIGYQVGTGVMIGLPFQTLEDLANDLLFMKEIEIDMCGMGPYIEQVDTPLYKFKEVLKPQTERLFLSQKMIAILRIIMPDINIAAATSLQAIDKKGKLMAITSGGNIIMPNITPMKYRNEYKIYDNKPINNDLTMKFLFKLKKDIETINHQMELNEWGDSHHFYKINQK